MLLTQKLTLDLIPSQKAKTVYVDQHDSGRGLEIHLTENGNRFVIPSGTTVSFDAKTAGRQFCFPALSVEGDAVIFAIPQEVTDHAGVVQCGLSLRKDDVRCGTQNFLIEVQQSSDCL